MAAWQPGKKGRPPSWARGLSAEQAREELRRRAANSNGATDGETAPVGGSEVGSQPGSEPAEVKATDEGKAPDAPPPFAASEAPPPAGAAPPSEEKKTTDGGAEKKATPAPETPEELRRKFAMQCAAYGIELYRKERDAGNVKFGIPDFLLESVVYGGACRTVERCLKWLDVDSPTGDSDDAAAVVTALPALDWLWKWWSERRGAVHVRDAPPAPGPAPAYPANGVAARPGPQQPAGGAVGSLPGQVLYEF